MGNYMFIQEKGINMMNIKFQLTRAFLISTVATLAFSVVAMLVREEKIVV